MSDQDSTAGKVDAELARARDLRDVSDWLTHSSVEADIQRDLFLRDLVEQSADTRLGNQDADGAKQFAGAEARVRRPSLDTANA
jgi:hypothetical protein